LQEQQQLVGDILRFIMLERQINREEEHSRRLEETNRREEAIREAQGEQEESQRSLHLMLNMVMMRSSP
jgi:hypothetical protein